MTQTTDSIDDLIQHASAAQLITFQCTLIEALLGLERRLNAISTEEQRRIEEILTQCRHFQTAPPSTAEQARIEQAHPISYDAHPSYQIASSLIYNWEDDESPSINAREAFSQFLILNHQLWHAHDRELISNIDDEDVHTRGERWANHSLKALIHQNENDPIQWPYDQWRKLIDHQQTYRPNKRTTYLAHIRDIDRRNHWVCDIPEINMIHAVVRGPQHIWEITKTSNWQERYDDPLIEWNELLTWKNALVRITDPDMYGLFEMIQEATNTNPKSAGQIYAMPDS